MRRRSIARGFGFGLLAAALVGLVGCGGGPQYAEVEGTVTQNGKPLDNIQVTFQPDGSGPRSVATTDAAGKYVLKSEGDGRNGAVVGPHKVVLRDLSIYPETITRDMMNQDFGKGKKIRVPVATYGDVTKTPLQKSVAAGQKNTIDLEVK